MKLKRKAEKEMFFLLASYMSCDRELLLADHFLFIFQEHFLQACVCLHGQGTGQAPQISQFLIFEFPKFWDSQVISSKGFQDNFLSPLQEVYQENMQLRGYRYPALQFFNILWELMRWSTTGMTMSSILTSMGNLHVK